MNLFKHSKLFAAVGLLVASAAASAQPWGGGAPWNGAGPWNGGGAPWNNGGPGGWSNNMPWSKGDWSKDLPWNSRPSWDQMPWNSSPAARNNAPGMAMPWSNVPFNVNNVPQMPWAQRGPNGWNNSPRMPWGNNGPSMPFTWAGPDPWTDFWNAQRRVPFTGNWFQPWDPKGTAERFWDEAINAPHDMGPTPVVGLQAPSIDIPNAVEVGDELGGAAWDFPSEMADQMDNFTFNPPWF